MFTIIGRLVIASSFSVGIFLLMSYLIAPGDMPPEPGEEGTPITITRKERAEESPTELKELPPPPSAQNSPPPLMAMAAPAQSSSLRGFSPLSPSNPKSGPIGGTLIDNQRATPIIYFAPEYPERQLARNIEGWVMLQFTITADGGVADIEVIDGEPEGAFDNAAIRTLRRWSYQPKMVAGRPVPQHNKRELFRFEIED